MDIVVEIQGGNLAVVYGDRRAADVNFTLVDWDNIEAGGRAETIDLVPLDKITPETQVVLAERNT